MLTRSSLLYRNFITNIKWNALSAIYYQTVLTLFMVWLFKITSLTMYGLIGTIFALLYLLIDLLDFGFDGSLAIDFKLFSKSKLSFKKIFLTQQLCQVALLSLVSLGFFLSYKAISSWFIIKFGCTITPEIWLTLGLLLISEGILKDLRALAQLFFLSKILALTQILGITIYTGLVLLNYYLFGFSSILNLNLIFAPLLLSALVNLIILSWAIYSRYQELPKLPIAPSSSGIPIKVLIVQRFWVFLNQISKLPFNSNFLITLLAFLFGTMAVAPLKLISRITVFLRYIIYHGLGLPIRSLLSQTQARLNFRNCRTILAHSFYFLAGILICAGIILILLTVLHTASLEILMRENSLIFLGILLLDNLFLAHEQYLLVTNKIYFFVIPNLITAGLIYSLVNNYSPTLNSLLLTLAALRILTFILINLVLIKKLVEKTPQSL